MVEEVVAVTAVKTRELAPAEMAAVVGVVTAGQDSGRAWSRNLANSSPCCPPDELAASYLRLTAEGHCFSTVSAPSP